MIDNYKTRLKRSWISVLKGAIVAAYLMIHTQKIEAGVVHKCLDDKNIMQFIIFISSHSTRLSLRRILQLLLFDSSFLTQQGSEKL